MLRAWIVIGMIAGGARAAVAAPPGPIRVDVECESEDEARTKACPAFLLGFVDANKVLLQAPRASADVVLYASVQEIALVDRVHLRFVGTIVGAPPVVEVDADLDSRADDDGQRAQLEPAFLRGIALFVAARHPKAVTISLSAPDTVPDGTPETSPWDLKLELGGFANYTQKFRMYNGSVNLSASRLERRSRIDVAARASGGLNRQPALTLDDGTVVALDTDQWELGSNAGGTWLYDDCWSFGVTTRIVRDDPKGQFRHAWNAAAGIEWDKYPADDPRGNRLAVLYVAGFQVDRYNLPNVLGERFASYPTHDLIASGTLRKDKIGIGVSLTIGGMMFDPQRRHHITAAPFVDLQLGGHVDLNLALSITKRELPGPDLTQVDPADYATLSRLSYAEPFAMNGSLTLSLHLDRTNGARNDRFTDI